jgi:hypothetical protein
MSNLNLPLSGSAAMDADMLSVTNTLLDGQSDNPNAYLAASLAGYGGTCTGVRGRNGNGSAQRPSVGVGVYGDSDNGYGVYASSVTNTAGYFESTGGFAIQAVGAANNDAITATGNSGGHAAVSGTNNAGGTGLWGASPGAGGIGVYARGAKYAGQFDGVLQVNGNANVTGTLTAVVDVVLGSDCAEDFEIDPSLQIDPGTVMVLTDDGSLQPSASAYDKKVAGVISGAGDYKPGLILGRSPSSHARMPIALIGKVYCKVDARYGAIEVGDLLTTSPTAGHAMRAGDQTRAFGAVIGKALLRLEEGQSLIPILVALQ